jgi:hypothetical protein
LFFKKKGIVLNKQCRKSNKDFYSIKSDINKLKPTNKQRKYCESHRRRQQMKLNRAAHIETALVTIVKWVTPTLPSLTASPSVASLFLPDREKMLKEIISHKKKKGPKEEGAAMRARTYTVVLIYRVATQSTAPRSHPRLPWLLILFYFFFLSFS